MKGRVPPALAIVCVAGALLRFATLDVQSLWYDEAASAHLLRMGVSEMLHGIGRGESSPPLYYVLAWLWARAFGTGAIGLRSLSALLGTADDPRGLGARAPARRRARRAPRRGIRRREPRPWWFGQEARAYALLVLLGALAGLAWLRALERPNVGRMIAWSIVAALALATHYYAIFLVAPQALWLLVAAPSTRARLAAVAVPLAAVAALAPLALAQRSNDTARFIADTPLATRVAQIPKQFLVGYDAPSAVALAIVMAVAMLIAFGGLVAILARRIEVAEGERDDALRLMGIVAAALVLPVLASLAGEDHLLTRNVVAVLPLALVLAGAGLAGLTRAGPEALRRSTWVAAAAACLLGLLATVGVARDPLLQRDDWRDAAHALGPPSPGRLIVAPGPALVPLGYYVRGLRHAPAAPAPTVEIDYVDLAERTPGQVAEPRGTEVPPPTAGFALAGRTDGRTFSVVRMRAGAPQLVAPAAVSTGLDGRPAAVLTTP